MTQAARLHRAGRLAEAIAVYRRVIKAAPKTAEAHNNLAADPEIDPQRLARPGAALLRRQPPVAKLLERLAADATATPVAGSLPRGLYEALATPLPLVMLSDALIPDAGIEALLVALRRLWLSADLRRRGRRVAAARIVRCRCATGGGRGVGLAGKRAGARRSMRRLLAFALYRPLAALPEAQTAALCELGGTLPAGPARDLFARQLTELREEAALAATLPGLTEIADATSRQVQYEENAYPRWRRLTRHSARPLAEVLREQVRRCATGRGAG